MSCQRTPPSPTHSSLPLPLPLQLALTRQGRDEFTRVVEARHAAALQAKESACEAAVAAARAAADSEVAALRTRCEAAVRDSREKALAWRERYFEATRALEAAETAGARLGKDIARAEASAAAIAEVHGVREESERGQGEARPRQALAARDVHAGEDAAVLPVASGRDGRAAAAAAPR